MRKLITLALCLGLAAALCVNSLAAASAEIVRAFVYEDTLYTYISMDGMGKPITKAETKVSGQVISATDRLETVRQAGSPVTWLLMVDNSGSMPAFRKETEQFAQALAQAAGEQTRFILSTFGNAFALVSEDVPAEELAEAVSALPFNEGATRLHTAIGQALDYFEELPRERNELRCMVILSDAVQYDPRGGVPYEELMERVGQSDVMLHSIGLGTNRKSLDSLGRLASASGGLHQEIDAQTAEDAANRLAEAGGELFVTGFDLSGCTSEGGVQWVSVTFASGAELLCRAETQVDLPELIGSSGQPAQPNMPPAQEPPASAAADPSPAPTPTPAPSPAPLPDNLSSSEAQGLPILPILAAVIVLIVTVAAVFLLRRRRVK